MCEPPPEIDPEWYARVFGALYPVVYAHRSVEQAGREATFAAECVNLTSEDRALDLCCGAGRHMVHLTRRCRYVAGLDFSPQLLRIAAKAVGSSAGLVRADMRAIPFVGQFDVVFNFFTSFGYFLQEDDNERVVREIARALRPGGRFFIDYVNRPFVERRLAPETRRAAGLFEIVEHRWIDRDRHRVNKRIRIYRSGRLHTEAAESVRLYTRDEFCHVLESGGLEVEKLYGEYRKGRFTDDLPRMIAVGRKR